MTDRLQQTAPSIDLALAGDLPDDVAGKDFRDAMAAMASAVCLVTAGTGDDRLGRTVTAGFSLTVSPPSVVVSIDATSALVQRIRAEQGFSFAVLAQPQRDVADAFAGKLPPERRFDHGEWSNWPSGQPRLHGAVSAMDCAVLGEVAMAGHVLFVGGARGIDLEYDRSPLVWHRRAYQTVQPL